MTLADTAAQLTGHGATLGRSDGRTDVVDRTPDVACRRRSSDSERRFSDSKRRCRALHAAFY